MSGSVTKKKSHRRSRSVSRGRSRSRSRTYRRASKGGRKTRRSRSGKRGMRGGNFFNTVENVLPQVQQAAQGYDQYEQQNPGFFPGPSGSFGPNIF